MNKHVSEHLRVFQNRVDGTIVIEGISVSYAVHLRPILEQVFEATVSLTIENGEKATVRIRGAEETPEFFKAWLLGWVIGHQGFTP